MQAYVYAAYGPPEVLQLQTVDKPTPTDSQVLVKVAATSINPAECHLRNGMLLARLLGGGGVLRPKPTIPGADFAGVVEAVGSGVTRYRPGDEVYGRRGQDGLAEYVCVSEKPITHKPAGLTFEQAAAVPVAAMTALQSLRDDGQLQAGQTVLINGGSGGVGTFTVQIAKALGAHVTAVCSTRNVELVRSLGADRVIDYTTEDYTGTGQTYDLIIDNVGNRTVGAYARTLRPNGRCVIVGFKSVGLLLHQQVVGRLASRLGKKPIGSMLAQITAEDLGHVNDLMTSGRVVPVIDRCYPFSQAVEAFRYAEAGHARGKVIITQ